MIYAGCDPGLKGGIAILKPNRPPLVVPMPVYRVGPKRVYDLEKIVELFVALPKSLVVIEAVTRPGSLVGNAAFIHGVALALGHEVQRPRPQSWKAWYGLSADKKESIALANKLYPSLKITKAGDDGLAESVLLARYGKER